MTEKEAIEILVNDESYITDSFYREFRTIIADRYTRAFRLVLKALEQKDKEISELKAKYDKDTHTLQNQLDVANADRVEKDKMIKAMAKYLNSTDIDEDICKTVSKEFDCTLYQNENFCINCIIGYFKEEVRKENE